MSISEMEELQQQARALLASSRSVLDLVTPLLERRQVQEAVQYLAPEQGAMGLVLRLRKYDAEREQEPDEEPQLTPEEQQGIEALIREATLLSPTTMGHLRTEANWLKQRPVEHFVGFAVDRRGEIVGRVDRCDNQPTKCTVDPDAVVQEAVSHPSTRALITLHNHADAGAAEPSAADRTFTDDLREALRRHGVGLMDHLIVAASGHAFSFREEHWPVLDKSWHERQRRLETRGF